MKSNTTLLLIVLALIACLPACSERSSVGIEPESIGFYESSAAKESANPWKVQRQGVMLVADFADSFGPVEKPTPAIRTIEFENVPAPAPEPDGKQPVSQSFRPDPNAAVLEKLSEIQRQAEEIRDSMLTKDDVREVVKEELEPIRQLIVEWRDSQGNVGESVVSIDEDGKGTAELPPGAVVTQMGGIPIEQYRAENPGAIFDSSPLSSASTTAQFYEGPGHFAAQSSWLPGHTQFDVQVDPQYIEPSAGSGCYEDGSGNWVCPDDGQTASPPAQASGPVRGILGRLLGR